MKPLLPLSSQDLLDLIDATRAWIGHLHQQKTYSPDRDERISRLSALLDRLNTAARSHRPRNLATTTGPGGARTRDATGQQHMW